MTFGDTKPFAQLYGSHRSHSKESKEKPGADHESILSSQHCKALDRRSV